MYVCVCMYMCIYVCMYVYTYIYIYIDIYMHIYTYCRYYVYICVYIVLYETLNRLHRFADISLDASHCELGLEFIAVDRFVVGTSSCLDSNSPLPWQCSRCAQESTTINEDSCVNPSRYTMRHPALPIGCPAAHSPVSRLGDQAGGRLEEPQSRCEPAGVSAREGHARLAGWGQAAAASASLAGPSLSLCINK